MNGFWNFFKWRVPEENMEWRKFLLKTLILAFEVIVHPPKTYFWHLQKYKNTIIAISQMEKMEDKKKSIFAPEKS